MAYEVLNRFHEVASSPQAQMQKYLSEGKKVVLTVPYYNPDELIASMGFVAMGVWGADMELERAKEYCPAFLCSIVQSILELGIKGKYEGASAIVVPSLCDTLKTLGQNWKYAVKDIPFIPMTYPQNRKPAYGIAFTKAQYNEQIIPALEKAGGKFDEDALEEQIAIYNKHNQLMRKADELMAKHPEITAMQRSDVFKSAFAMEKSEHSALLEEFIAELEAAPAATPEMGIVVSGILTDSAELNKIFDDMGMTIVADDVAAQSRQYMVDAEEGTGDGRQALADKFAAMDYCSTLYVKDKVKPHIANIIEKAKARDAKGVVVVLTKFCDPEEFDYPLIKKACDEADLPLTLVEVDRQMVHFEQIRTNIETFRDVLSM